MSFIREHLPPTLHNAIGTVIGTLLLLGLGGAAAFIPRLRALIISFFILAVPVWLCLCFLAVIVVVAIVLRRRRRKTTAAVVAQIQVRHTRERDAQQQRIGELSTDVERLTRERDDTVEQKSRLMFRLQDLSKRLGDVVTIRPASGAERTKPRDT